MKLSVIIPAYNEEKYIDATIRQFAALAIPHEVIVGDGRSTDRTQEIAHAAGAIVAETPDGIRSPARQRNVGAGVAQGEFLLFIDSTVLLPEINVFLQRALAHFEDPAVVGLALPQRIYPEFETRTDAIMLTITNCINGLQRLGSGKFMLMRRASFVAIGGFRENLVTREDGDFFLRLKKIGMVIFDPSLTILYSGRREHAWGWPKLLFIWTRDVAAVTLFDRSMSKEWIDVR